MELIAWCCALSNYAMLAASRFGRDGQNFRRQIDGAGQTDIDAMAELWFDSMTEYQAAIHSPQGDAVRNDRHGFFDQARSRWMLLDELVVS